MLEISQSLKKGEHGMKLGTAMIGMAVLILSSVPASIWGDYVRAWNFENDREDVTPRGFEVAVGTWMVARDSTAPSKPHVVAQLASSSYSAFNVVLANRTNYKDVELSVELKAVDGEIDQGGGVVWRAKDAKNYYIARYNPLEDNYRVYKVVQGRRRQLQSARIKRQPGWHTLRVTMRGDHIECFFDGKKYLDVRDATFQQGGRVGLWTKADAVTYFDDLKVSALDARQLDVKRIAETAGTKATVSADGVVRIGWPRTDVALTVDGMPFNPAAGLGSWAAFKATKHGAMVMGDTVVFQDEVAPAMDAAFASGLEVSALHNHFFYDEPKVYFMHIGGRGAPEKLAGAVKNVWDAIKTVRAKRPQPASKFSGGVPQPGSISQSAIEEIVGHKGKMNNGILKIAIGRQGAMHGTRVTASMGLSSWVAFSGSDKFAAIDGDFIMTGEEVQPVLRALRKVEIYVVALHNHMIGEKPTFYFTHFWAKGPAKKLAKGIREALQAQENARR